jgi:hypothetical protein
MKNNKRLVGELLQKIDAPEIAALLLDEEDHIIRSFAAKSLAKSADFHPTFAKDLHHSIRIVAAENPSDESLISALIQDKHSAVRKAAIANAVEQKLQLDEKILISGLASSDPSLRSLIATLAVANGGKILEKACKDSNPKVKKSIVDTLRNDVDEVDKRIENIAKIAPDIVVRWLKSRYDQDSSELRWSMIENNSVNPRLRSKLIEQMEGRSDVDKQRLANLAKGNSILVNVAAKNLSASIDELEE